MSSALQDNGSSGVAILSRVVGFGDLELNPDAARSVLSLTFPKSDERRMNVLSAKARKGKLTDRERMEAEQYNLVSHLLALLQARARAALEDEQCVT